MNRMDRDRSGWVPTDQSSHDTTDGRRDAEEVGNRVCIQKLVLSGD